MALRRWKPFLGAFQHVDAAIESAAAGDLSRDEFRRTRGRIVEMLCDAAADDDAEKAEGLCLLLDDAMAEALVTLRAVPAEKVVPRVLASDELVGAIGALMRGHGSERVRGLARDVVRGWRAGVEEEHARARAAMDVLNGLSSGPLPSPEAMAPAAVFDTKKQAKFPVEQRSCPKKTAAAAAPVVVSGRVNSAKICDPLSRKSAPVVGRSHVKPSRDMEASREVHAPPPKKTAPDAEEKKFEATKRKLQERYQEAEDAKRRRTIQVIKAPPPATTGQRRRKAHPAVRARGPASCAAESRYMVSSVLRFR